MNVWAFDTLSFNAQLVMSNKYQSVSNETLHIDLQSIINRLLESQGRPVQFAEIELKQLISGCKYIFVEQPIILELEGPVKIVGDIHGQFIDLINIFKMSGYPGDTNYLFLGDYVDRGHMSLECLVLLLCYKIKYPENIFLLRGNHEISSVNRLFGFYDQCKRKASVKIWKMFNELFNMLPLCAVIQRKIFCVHGGLSPQLESVDQLGKMIRPLEITNQGIALDLLWSDPEPFISGWQQNQRGISYIFGADSVHAFLRDNNFDLIVRSHQVVEMGYEFMFNKQLVTIFSAPNYMGEYENYGAVMVVQENLKCSFEIIKPKLIKNVNKGRFKTMYGK